jgi:hypothetical protein
MKKQPARFSNCAGCFAYLVVNRGLCENQRKTLEAEACMKSVRFFVEVSAFLFGIRVAAVGILLNVLQFLLRNFEDVLVIAAGFKTQGALLGHFALRVVGEISSAHG